MTELFDLKAPEYTEEQAKKDLQAVIANTEFPPYAEYSELLHPEVYADIKREWEKFDGPVNNPNNFLVFSELEYGLFVVAHYIQGDLTLDVLPEEDIDWTLGRVVEKADTVKAVQITLPNAKCKCGSGRKSKKCCNRFV